MNCYIKLIALSLIIGLSACEKDANVDLPVVESKLVISSFISPLDTTVRVDVTISQPLYNNANSNQFSAVNNATVQINDGTNFQTLAYNDTGNYYFFSTALFPLSVGTTYYLTVSTPDGKSVSAHTSIPSVNTTLTYSSQAINNPNATFNSWSIKTNWNDSPGSIDYYRISYYSKQSIDGIDTTYLAIFSEDFTDNGSDGKVFNQNIEVNDIVSLGELFLIHASEEYYLYHSKLKEAAFSDGPFSEPVQMYTNIVGGFGVFAGYNPYIVHVSL